MSPAALQHAVTDDHLKSRINPQRISLANSNSVQDLKRNYLSVSWPMARTVQCGVGSDKSGFLRSQMSDNRFDHKLAERQPSLYILSSPALANRSTEELRPLASFGLAAPVVIPGAWLEESLNELSECSSCALDEGLEEPSELGLTKARELLEEVSAFVTNRPDVYPMDEGGIAIDFRNPEIRSGVLFLVEQDGSGVLFHRTKSSKGRLRVDDAADLLQEGGFLELKRVGIR